MPGICGIVGGDVAHRPELLAGMVARMRHHPWYQENCYCPADGALAMAALSLGSIATGNQPATNENGALLAVIAGEIYDYALHRESLTSRGHRFQGESPAELLLHGFESDGIRFFRGLHGTFSAAIWDGSSHRLILTNDRFGMLPTYYALLPDCLLFASEIKALLADPRLPRKSHLPSIAQFFTFGQLLGEDTMFQQVRTLPPATCLSYRSSSNDVTAERYWSAAMVGSDRDTSESESRARLETTFVSAVERRTVGRKRLGISLSGGIDSRTILGVIDHKRLPVTAVTLGVEGCLDARSAQQMAALVGCRYHFHPITTAFLSRFEEHLTSMVQLTDGQLQSEGVIMPSLPVYRDLNIEALIRGHGGELLHMDDAYNFSMNAEGLALKDGPALEQWLFGRLQTYYGLDPSGGRLFAQACDSDLTAAARNSLRVCLRESENLEGPVQRVSHLFLTQMLPRQCAVAMRKYGSLLEVRLPYLDEDFIDAVLTAPPTLRIGHRSQVHILRKRAPELLQVVNSNTGARPGAGALKLFTGKVRLRLFNKLGLPGYQPYSRMGLWLRNELRSFVHRIILCDRCLDRGIFNSNTVRLIVEQHVSGQRNYTDLILALLIFEIGQREFIDGNQSIMTGGIS